MTIAAHILKCYFLLTVTTQDSIILSLTYVDSSMLSQNSPRDLVLTLFVCFYTVVICFMMILFSCELYLNGHA